MSGAIVLLSGGMDSAVCLYRALREPGGAHALTFDLGAPAELAAARAVAGAAGAPHTVLPLDAFASLPRGPSGFVPSRNLVLCALAAAFALGRTERRIIIGTTRPDRDAYPDGRPKAVAAIGDAVSACLPEPFAVEAPLLELSKAAVVALARELGAFEALAWTRTCARGLFPPCGACPPCLLRADGFAKAGLADPLLARARCQTSVSK